MYFCSVIPEAKPKKERKKYGKKLSPTFNKNQDFVSWIQEHLYIEMLIQHFPNFLKNISIHGCSTLKGTIF